MNPNFTIKPDKGYVDTNFIFSVSSSLLSQCNSIVWNFGDGTEKLIYSNSPVTTAQHNFAQPSIYSVNLYCLDSDNTPLSAFSANINVLSFDGAYFTVSPNDYGYTQSTSFTFLINDETLETYANFYWDFGDNVGNSTDPSPSYTYTRSGDYKVTLYVYDGNQNVKYIYSKTIKVRWFLADAYSGYAKATPIYFNNKLTGYNNFLWDFGDNTYSREQNPTHTYQKPGKYTVKFTFFDSNGNSITDTDFIEIKFFLNESIYFDFVPPATYAGHLNRYPFRLNITSSSTDSHYIDLGAQFSKSYKYQEPENKWSFLRPQWRFLDKSGKQIDTIKTIDTPIKIDKYGNLSSTGTVIGVSGFAEFYFIDDLYNLDLAINNQPYTTIIATLQTSALPINNGDHNYDDKTPSFANSLATITVPHIFLSRDPDFIEITENLNNQIPKIKFTNQNIPFLINLGFNKNYSYDDLYDGNNTQIVNKFEFAHYIPNDSSFNLSINLSAFNLSGNELNFNYIPNNIQFNFKDSNGFISGGYYKGTFSYGSSSIDNYITANGYYPIPNKASQFYNPVLWISNPNAGMIAPSVYFKNPSLDSITNQYLDKRYTNAFNMPILSPKPDVDFFATNSYATSGYHGIYSIAALPAPTYHAWMVDSELDMLYRVSFKGDILVTVDLQNTVVNNGFIKLTEYVNGKVTPCSVSVDGNNNVWVALYDTPHVLKFDNKGNLLKAATFNQNLITYPTNKFFLDSQSAIIETDPNITLNPPLTLNDLIINPTFVETDLDNNIWVSYSSPVSGWLVKYDTNGTQLTALSYPAYSCPQEIVCDNKNNIWVVLSEDVGARNGYLNKLDSKGNVLSSYGAFNGINHITLDVNQNPWFTYSYDWVGTIQNGIFTKIEITDFNYFDYGGMDWFKTKQQSRNINNVDDFNNADETALEGIASDIKNNIYVIHSIENRIYVINANDFTLYDNFIINPKGFSFNLSAERTPTYMTYDQWNKSLQASGDWSGFRWYNKYSDIHYNDPNKFSVKNGTYYKFLSGNSSIEYNTNNIKYFSIYDRNYYDLFKINENFDLTKQIKSFSFQECLQNSQNLFDIFLNPIFNNTTNGHDALGTSTYEKIANFISNQSDIDTCDVNSLYDLSNQISLDTDDFRLNYPIDIRRSMDILSINQSRLFGSYTDDSYNFNTISKNGNENRGDLLDSKTYVVSAGIPIILKKNSLEKYQLINTGKIDTKGNLNALNVSVSGSKNYSLSSLANYLQLGSDWERYYEFYSYKPSNNLTLSDNLVDWDLSNFNRDQMISFLNKTINQKYPDTFLNWNTDDGVMEFIFTYQFYKGLGLI